jgi:acyl carrier protein
MNAEVIIENLRAALGKVVDVVPAEITTATTLREDLGLDSFAALELLFELEEKVGINIPQSAVADLRTVGDVVVFVQNAQRGELPAAAPPPPAEKVSGA